MTYWNGTAWVESEGPTARRDSRATRWGATVVMIIVAGLLILPFAGASAGQSGGAWIALNRPTTLSVSGTNTATFSIGQKRTSEPWVRVNCHVNAVLAYSQLLGYFPSYPYGQVFTFDSNYLQWNYDNLPLDCTARLEWRDSKGSEHVMASTDFVVNP
jgi:hypothetical protein